MPRPKAPDRMRRSLDAILLRQLERGKIDQVVGGKVVEVDLSPSMLEVCRKRLKDLGVARPPDNTIKNAVRKLARAAHAKSMDMPPADPNDPLLTGDRIRPADPSYDEGQSYDRDQPVGLLPGADTEARAEQLLNELTPEQLESELEKSDKKIARLKMDLRRNANAGR